MDTFLIVLTVLSFAACVGCGILTWRTIDIDRRRSAARVAALAAEVVADDPIERPFDTPQAVPVSSLFGTKPGGAVGAPPFLKAAVVGALGIALIVTAAMTLRDDRHPSATPSDPAPLELITMTHRLNGNRLTVTGTVRNPKNGASLGHIEAVVAAFDRGGSVAASGTAPVDFLNLAPGDASPFVVIVPGAGAVSRYRVSFRNGASVLRHIDRRAESQLAVR